MKFSGISNISHVNDSHNMNSANGKILDHNLNNILLNENNLDKSVEES
jgi:hypothetical protein